MKGSGRFAILRTRVRFFGRMIGCTISSVNREIRDACAGGNCGGRESPVVLVQDYHFALLAAHDQGARPDARVAIFWHIPWPNPEAFRHLPLAARTCWTVCWARI